MFNLWILRPSLVVGVALSIERAAPSCVCACTVQRGTYRHRETGISAYIDCILFVDVHIVKFIRLDVIRIGIVLYYCGRVPHRRHCSAMNSSAFSRKERGTHTLVPPCVSVSRSRAALLCSGPRFWLISARATDAITMHVCALRVSHISLSVILIRIYSFGNEPCAVIASSVNSCVISGSSHFLMFSSEISRSLSLFEGRPRARSCALLAQLHVICLSCVAAEPTDAYSIRFASALAHGDVQSSVWRPTLPSVSTWALIEFISFFLSKCDSVSIMKNSIRCFVTLANTRHVWPHCTRCRVDFN